MKTLHSFLKLVEIRTKVASILPLTMGTLLAIYLYDSFNLNNFLLMFFSLISIDLATTGFNHYFDYKRAILKSGYHYQHHNPISAGEISDQKSLWLLMGLVVVGGFAGIALAFRTDIIVLGLGMLSFAVGMSYSTGPLPISRTILGEFFSGTFMGGLIPFIAFYIHVPKGQLWNFAIEGFSLTIAMEIEPFVTVILSSMPLVFLIANIMLANNICDTEEDLVNLRYTLPVSIGIKRSLILYQGLVIAAYLTVVLGVFVSYLPLASGLILLTIPVVLKQTRAFVKSPQKSTTFKLAVKNFLVFTVTSIIAIGVAILLN